MKHLKEYNQFITESNRDPKSIQKEYKDLKKQSISYLRSEWSRNFRVGDPKGTDKTGLISDILRARHGDKYVNAAFESVNELKRTPLSGTMSGSTESLEDRKYELKKDAKGATIGNFSNVTLPKGTIIYNLPGGVFADHFSLKNKYSSRSSQGPQYFDKPTFKGIMIKQTPAVLSYIEKNSKVLESFDTEIHEAKAYKLKASEFGADTHSAAYNVKGEPTWRVHSTYAIDQVSGENNPEERDVVFFEAMPINNDIYIKIGGINNLKRTNGATVGENFGTTIEEWKKDPKGIAKEASKFLTDATHLKWLNKKARSEGQTIKWALKDDYSSVIEDLVNKSLGL